MSILTDLTVSRGTRRSILPTLAFSVIFGTAAGVVGTLVVLAYAAPGFVPATSFPVRSDAVRAAPFISREDFDAARRASALLAPAKPANAPLGGAYAPGEATGAALVLTSDGWLVTSATVSGAPAATVAVVGGTAYPVRRVVVDPYSGATFLKVDATNLPVIAFGAADAVSIGDDLYAADAAAGAVRLSVLANDLVPAVNADGLVRSSERLQTMIRASGPAVLPGAAILNADGDVLGLAGASGEFGTTVISVTAFSPVMADVLRDGRAARPVLGANFMDLSAVRTSAAKGALVTASPDGRRPAVLRRSPAESSGIRQGDIITAVDGDPIVAGNSLDAAVARFKPGETAAFTVLRGRLPAEITVNVTFGSSVPQ